MRLVLVGIIGLCVAATLSAQDASACAAHHAAVDQTGDQVMGFDHDKTTHHFTLTADGGIVAVSANDDADTASRDAIRSHLSHIAKIFAAGDFDAPMLIHDQVPPGVPIMKKDKASIRYDYEETKTGAQIVISTENPRALAAVHDFLHFQIADHGTGDSGDVQPSPASKK
jgi:hypothetical protein